MRPSRITIRGYKCGALVWEKQLVVRLLDLDGVLPALAEEHWAQIDAGIIGMIELEFLDVPEGEGRFFRIGVEHDGMVMPMRVL